MFTVSTLARSLVIFPKNADQQMFHWYPSQ